MDDIQLKCFGLGQKPNHRGRSTKWLADSKHLMTARKYRPFARQYFATVRFFGETGQFTLLGDPRDNVPD